MLSQFSPLPSFSAWTILWSVHFFIHNTTGIMRTKRKKKELLLTLALAGCKYTTKHHSATWRNLQTTMGRNFVRLGRGCYYTSLVSVYAPLWIKNSHINGNKGKSLWCFRCEMALRNPCFPLRDRKRFVRSSSHYERIDCRQGNCVRFRLVTGVELPSLIPYLRGLGVRIIILD